MNESFKAELNLRIMFASNPDIWKELSASLMFDNIQKEQQQEADNNEKKKPSLLAMVKELTFAEMQNPLLLNRFQEIPEEFLIKFLNEVKQTSNYVQYLNTAACKRAASCFAALFLLRTNRITTVKKWIDFYTNINNNIDPAVAAEINRAIEDHFDNHFPKNPSASVISDWEDFLRHLFFQLVKRRVGGDVVSSLTLGNSHRHTNFPRTGLRARDAQLAEIAELILRVRDSKNAKEAPLISVTGPPRNGKTALLDALGYILAILYSLISDEDKKNVADVLQRRTFVLNTTFNAAWHVENKAMSVDDALAYAKKQIKLRLLSAAANAFVELSNSDLHYEEKQLLHWLASCDLFENSDVRDATTAVSSVVSNLILPALRFARGIQKNEQVYCFFLFDEFSNLEPKYEEMNLKEDKIKELRSKIYSLASNLIKPTSAVVVSGFKPVPDLETDSGRPVVAVHLEPIVESTSRRDIGPMKTLFFHAAAELMKNPRFEFADPENLPFRVDEVVDFHFPLALFEMIKSNVGVFGVVL